MRAGFLILCVGLYCILQAVGFPFCAPRAYSVFQIFGCPVHLYARGFPHFVCRAALHFVSDGLSVLRAAGLFRVFCLPPVRSCFLRVYGALCVLRTGGFFLVLQAMWFVRRAADGGMRRPLIRHFVAPFPPRGREGYGTDPAQQRNTGTALRIFARERTRARRSVFLQGRERGHGAPYVCKGKEYGRCVPHLCTRTVSAFVHGRGIRR